MMTRTLIRLSKKAIHAGTAKQASPAEVDAARAAALSLLHHSVQHRHKQLALIRLLNAVQLSADIDAVSWDHCLTVARASASPQELQLLYAMRGQCASRQAL
ncbi:hypothetical protein [Comamonas sp.]|uniref:hypothetical protein n=1 Tax=Comamonas sp. TaxID=34028 RepID=UPI003A924A59